MEIFKCISKRVDLFFFFFFPKLYLCFQLNVEETFTLRIQNTVMFDRSILIEIILPYTFK